MFSLTTRPSVTAARPSVGRRTLAPVQATKLCESAPRLSSNVALEYRVAMLNGGLQSWRP